MEVTVNCILKDERKSILKFDPNYKVVYNETKKQTPIRRSKYSEEFKKQPIKLVLESDSSCKEVAQF
jgi:hypothetical protein